MLKQRISAILGLVLTILTISSLILATPLTVGAAGESIYLTSVTDTSCTVNWLAAPSATNYLLIANTTLQNNPATAANSAGVTVSYTSGALTANVTGLLVATRYYFSVFVVAPTPASFLVSCGLAPRNGVLYTQRKQEFAGDTHTSISYTGLNGFVTPANIPFTGVSGYGYGQWFLNDGTETTNTVSWVGKTNTTVTVPKYDWFYFHQDYKMYSDAALTKEIGSNWVTYKYYGSTYVSPANPSDVSMRGGYDLVSVATITDPNFLGRVGGWKLYVTSRVPTGGGTAVNTWTIAEGYGDLAGLTGQGLLLGQGNIAPVDPSGQMFQGVNLYTGYLSLPIKGFYAQIQHSRTTATVNWAPVAGATSYKVVVNTTPQPNFATAVNGPGIVVIANIGLTSAEVSGITFNTPYYVSVWATAPNTVPLGCSDFTIPRPFFWWWWW